MDARTLIGLDWSEVGDDDLTDIIRGAGAVELVGGDVEIVGADTDMEELLKRVGDLDLIGAAPKKTTGLYRQAMVLQALQEAAKRRREREAIGRTSARRVVVREKTPTELNEIPLGFGPVIIPAGGTLPVEATPQVVFKTKRLILRDPDFWILQDVKVGNRSIFAAAGPVMGAGFARDTVGSNLRAQTASVNQKIIITAQNDTGAPQTFYAVMFGDAIE